MSRASGSTKEATILGTLEAANTEKQIMLGVWGYNLGVWTHTSVLWMSEFILCLSRCTLGVWTCTLGVWISGWRPPHLVRPRSITGRNQISRSLTSMVHILSTFSYMYLYRYVRARLCLVQTHIYVVFVFGCSVVCRSLFGFFSPLFQRGQITSKYRICLLFISPSYVLVVWRLGLLFMCFPLLFHTLGSELKDSFGICQFSIGWDRTCCVFLCVFYTCRSTAQICSFFRVFHRPG